MCVWVTEFSLQTDAFANLLVTAKFHWGKLKPTFVFLRYKSIFITFNCSTLCLRSVPQDLAWAQMQWFDSKQVRPVFGSSQSRVPN